MAMEHGFKYTVDYKEGGYEVRNYTGEPGWYRVFRGNQDLGASGQFAVMVEYVQSLVDRDARQKHSRRRNSGSGWTAAQMNAIEGAWERQGATRREITDSYGPRRGLEGPFRFKGGQVLYYDPREGAYWDPTTDMYLSKSEDPSRNSRRQNAGYCRVCNGPHRPHKRRRNRR